MSISHAVCLSVGPRTTVLSRVYITCCLSVCRSTYNCAKPCLYHLPSVCRFMYNCAKPCLYHLLSVCRSTAPEQMSCMSNAVQSRVVASLPQMVASMEPTRLSRSFSAAYSIDLLCSSVGIPSCTQRNTK